MITKSSNKVTFTSTKLFDKVAIDSGMKGILEDFHEKLTSDSLPNLTIDAVSSTDFSTDAHVKLFPEDVKKVVKPAKIIKKNKEFWEFVKECLTPIPPSKQASDQTHVDPLVYDFKHINKMYGEMMKEFMDFQYLKKVYKQVLETDMPANNFGSPDHRAQQAVQSLLQNKRLHRDEEVANLIDSWTQARKTTQGEVVRCAIHQEAIDIKNKVSVKIDGLRESGFTLPVLEEVLARADEDERNNQAQSFEGDPNRIVTDRLISKSGTGRPLEYFVACQSPLDMIANIVLHEGLM
eukprot:Platyproteum_vivax@DN13923_c0_g1_i1.p2